MDIVNFSKKEKSTKGTRTCAKRTICEVHRQLYDVLFLGLAKSNPELLKQAKPLLEEAFTMGIGMTKKLVNYKLVKSEHKKNRNPEDIKKLRELRIKLENTLKLDEVS